VRKLRERPALAHGKEKLRGDRLVGRFFAASRAKLREIADRIGVRRLVNLAGCPILLTRS
jgi:hypothetical protein